MPPNTQPLDIVALMAAVAAALFSPEIARFVGPYAVIFTGAVLGSAWSSSRLTTPTRLGVVLHILGMTTLALMVTVPIAEVVSARSNSPVNYWFGPVATFIGALGPDGVRAAYRLTLGWVIRRLGLTADDATTAQAKKEGDTP